MQEREPLLERHAIEDARRGLALAGLQGPHSYIRGLNADFDLSNQLDSWLRDLPASDDLRFAIGSSIDERWILMERLPWDSEFFDRGMARLNAVVQPGVSTPLMADVSLGVKALGIALDEARGRGIDYVFCTVAATDLPMIRTVGACGFELIETRCHYHRPLLAPPTERHATRLVTAADVPSLARAASTMVNVYDRFHADPAIAPDAAERLMEKWVHASILDGFADATIVPDTPEPEAFCTAKYHKHLWAGWGLRLAQPVLSAVSPKHKGWYVRIISELDEHLRGVGAEHSFLVTQLTNNAVIRCWEKLGYQFGKGEHIFRKLL